MYGSNFKGTIIRYEDVNSPYTMEFNPVVVGAI